ncbi:MAG: hypothetical protein ACT4N2_13310 [Hyphomicrobium sp.]
MTAHIKPCSRATRFFAVPLMGLAVMAGSLTAAAPKAEAGRKSAAAALAVGLVVGMAVAEGARRNRGWGGGGRRFERARFGGGGFGGPRCFTRQICSPDGWCETRSVC